MIPEIDVRSCIAKRSREGSLAFTFEADASLLDIPFVTFTGPVRAELSYRIAADDSVEVEGTIAFALQGSCSRCLEAASKEVVYQTEGVFVPGEGDGDGDVYGYKSGKVVLEEFLRDSVLFALPSRLLCKSCEQWENEE